MSDLDNRATYMHERAQVQVKTHARHFAAQVAATLTGTERAGRAADRAAGLMCAAYDAELFGHWWHEGPQWLDVLYPELSQHGIAPTTCSAALDRYPPARTITLPEGSWGEGGDHRTWLNNDTAWVWERLYDGEFQFWNVMQEMPQAQQGWLLRRVLCQAGRELLLMQSSDWPFLITTRTARDYAEQRFLAHYTDLKQLLQIARSVHERGQLESEQESFLAGRERQKFLFPTLEQVLFR
jgi:1,4-alpha-glucan branching enzyme